MKVMKDITAIVINIDSAEGGDVIFFIKGMCGRNVNAKNKVENPQPNHGIEIGLLIICWKHRGVKNEYRAGKDKCYSYCER